jgi:hypothetical protein
MSVLAILLTAFVALLHLGFLVLEMFFWTKPLGRKVFRLDPQVAKDSAKLAMNQGLYNGFLAAGLAWGDGEAVDPVRAGGAGDRRRGGGALLLKRRAQRFGLTHIVITALNTFSPVASNTSTFTGRS